MPIYEYRCEDCGTQFEKLVRRSTDAPEIECPSCGQKHLKQELSTFAAHAGVPSGPGSKSPEMPSCPNAGHCGNAGMCGMNFN
jgi:putative FmdB family regulatory protein